MGFRTPTEEFCDPEPPPLLVECWRELKGLWRRVRGERETPVHLMDDEQIDRLEG